MQTNRLSKREWDVVKLLLQGKSNKLIADSLDISKRTVEFHLKNIYAKYQVTSRTELILKLVNTTGELEIEKLRHSTVEHIRKIANNGGMVDSQKNRNPAPYSERQKTMNTNRGMIFKNALTGFAPSVFLVMAGTVLLDGIRYFTEHQNWESFLRASIMEKSFWEVFFLELLLLTSGYMVAAWMLGLDRLNFSWRRSALAGIGAVSGLALLSIFTQPASLIMIALASLLMGGMSSLFTLRKTPQAMGN